MRRANLETGINVFQQNLDHFVNDWFQGYITIIMEPIRLCIALHTVHYTNLYELT